MKRKLLTMTLIIFLLGAFPAVALAGSAILHWQTVSAPDLGGYRIYYGTAHRSYGPYIPVGASVTTYTLNGLVEGKTYYFALTAVDTSGNESGYSAEVSKTIASSSTTIYLPVTAAYGRMQTGDQTHVNGVTFVFSGRQGDVGLSYEVYDVDYSNEVRIVVNDHAIRYASKTANDAWGAAQTTTLPDKYVNDSQTNTVKFENTYNPPKKYWWGVRNVSLFAISTSTSSSSGKIPLPATGSYGMIRGGDQSHVNGVAFTFPGMAGNVKVSFEVWDIDNTKEVRISLNGKRVAYAPKTNNESWSGKQTITLSKKLVYDNKTNTLKFSNTSNPPKKYWWGVRNVAIE